MTPTMPFSAQRLKYAGTINDEALSESTDADFELAYIDIGNVDSQGRVHDIVNYRFEDAPSRARRIVRDGDVIISTVRTYLQAIAPVENPPDNLIVSTGFAVVRPSNLLDHRFCKYALRENKFLWEVESRSTGVSYPAINASDLGDIEVSLPEIGAQRLIASYLDRETARIDGLIAEKERMLALLEEKRTALISRIVTRGLDPDAPLKPSEQEWLGEIPAHWEILQLRFVCDSLQIGPFGTQLHAEEYVDNGVPVINPAHLKGNRITPDFGISVDEETAERLAVHRLAEGDIVFGRRGELGRCGIVEESQVGWLCGTGSLRVRCNKNVVEPSYVALVFNGTAAATRLTLESVGSTMDNLNTEMLGHFRIPLPPLDEQREIVRTVEIDQRKANALRGSLQLSINLAKERRAALITAAVTGQIPLEEISA